MNKELKEIRDEVIKLVTNLFVSKLDEISDEEKVAAYNLLKTVLTPPEQLEPLTPNEVAEMIDREFVTLNDEEKTNWMKAVKNAPKDIPEGIINMLESPFNDSD